MVCLHYHVYHLTFFSPSSFWLLSNLTVLDLVGNDNWWECCELLLLMFLAIVADFAFEEEERVDFQSDCK